MASHIKENSTHQENKRLLTDKCAVNGVLSFIGRRWLMSALYGISLGNDQFTLLKADMPSISDHILAARINDLVDGDLIQKREIEDSVPLGTRYVITAKGKDLLVLVDKIHQWDTRWKEE